ncbi:MAG: glycosyltransferase [Gammaproteobacteria bacterium]
MTERKLTVLQLLPSMQSGGVERGTLEVANELVRRGHRSLVISGGGRMVAALERGGSTHINWNIGAKSPFTLRYLLRLRRLMREQHIDIVHTRSRLPAWIAYLAWRGMDKATRPRFVTTVHGLYSVNCYSAIMTRGERIIAVSNTARDYLLKNYPQVDAQCIQVIPRGVDPAEFPYGYRPSSEWLAAWYTQFPQLRDKFVITLPGRLTRLKGHEDFISLMARLKRNGLPVHGLIVGGEDPKRQAYARALRDRVITEDLSGTITFTGQRDDMRDVYAASNVVLSLSTKPESFGRTVLEALSLGVPVVGYDHGGVGEILQTVFLAGTVPTQKFDKLYETINGFIAATPSVAAANYFLLNSMLDHTIQLYNELQRQRRI